MSWLSKATSWVGKTAGKLPLGKIASVILPIAGFAVGLAVPSLGAGISKLGDKLGNKLSALTGVADGKPGILGIGDGLPGLLGIGTGKGKAKTAAEIAKLVLASLQDKESRGEPLTNEETAAKKQAETDMKKDGVNPLVWLGGGLLAFMALRK